MRFYCTCGRGTEVFVHKELQHVFGKYLESVTPTDGKVFFEIKSGTSNLKLKLKSLNSVERLMIQLVYKAYGTLDKRGLLTLLYTEMGRPDIWRDYRSIASKLYHEESLLQSGNGDHTSASVGVSMSDNCTVCDPSKQDCPHSHYKTESSARATEVITDCNEHMDKVQTDNDDKSAVVELNKGKTSLSANDGEYLQGTEEKIEDLKGAVVKDHQCPIKCLDAGITSRGLNHKLDGNSVGLSSTVKQVLSSDIREHLHDRKRQKVTVSPSQTFRVSCKISGTVRRKLDTKRTSHQMGALIRKLTGWTVDMRNPTTEVCLHLNDETLTVGIPLTREPLSRRLYIKHCGLRTPVAWIMVHLLQPQTGEVVLDPMCGKGTILVEASQVCKGAMYLGMDKASSQLKVAMENVVYAGQVERIHLLQGDATGAPLPDSSVDKLVTDAPFGQNHVTDTDLHLFYKHMLIEMSRVLKPGGDMVMLTSTSVLTDLTRCEFPHHTGGDNQQTGDDGASRCIRNSHKICKINENVENQSTDFKSDNDIKCHSQFEYQSKDNMTDEPKDVENQSTSLEFGNDLKCHSQFEYQSKDNITNEPKAVESSERASSEYFKSCEDEQIPVIEKQYKEKSIQKKRLTVGKAGCAKLGTTVGKNPLNQFVGLHESGLMGSDLLICNLFELTSYHYMKLGETDGVVCVLKNVK